MPAACCAILLALPSFAAAAAPPPSRPLPARAALPPAQKPAILPGSTPKASRILSSRRSRPAQLPTTESRSTTVTRAGVSERAVRLISHRDRTTTDVAADTPANGRLQELRERSASRRWTQLKDSLRGSPSPAASTPAASTSVVSASDSVASPALRAPAEPTVPRERLVPRPDTTLDSPVAGTRTRALPKDTDAAPPAPPIPPGLPTRLVQRGNYNNSPAISDYTGSPDDLKKIGDIVPFHTYEPDADIAADDPCRNLCPRPDGEPCKQYDDPSKAPECPDEVRLGQKKFGGRHLPGGLLGWVAPNTTYRPLYYEDPALERYGHTLWGPVQSLVSLGRFSVQTASLPYQAVIHPYCDRVYPLGWYRPGDCAPKKCYQPPLSAKASANQASWVAGLIFLIP